MLKNKYVNSPKLLKKVHGRIIPVEFSSLKIMTERMLKNNQCKINIGYIYISYIS